MTKKRRRRGITPWKKTALKFCALCFLLAAGIHLYRDLKAYGFDDQNEARRWGTESGSAQVSAFLPAESSLKAEDVQQLEYKIHTALAQDSIKLTATGQDARLWQDCYSGLGNFTLQAGRKTVDVEVVGTGGAFFTFHPMDLSSGSYYLSDSLMQDEILLDQETAWKLFGSFNVEGRTVQVEDRYLRIAGVYKKGEGDLYDDAGLAEYVVFVQYKTLLQYGAGGGSGSSDEGKPGTATTSSEEVEINISSGDDSGASSDTGAASGNNAETGSEQNENSSSDDSGASNTNAAGTENLGTGNTAFKDTGKITCYEIVMPNPVEGYAAARLKEALGEDSGAIVVDNTNRYSPRHLMKDLQDFALLGMRTNAIRYPYWENVAMGWETIFAALFLAECLLILISVLLIIWMIIHWYRNKTWTVAGTIHNIQDSVYERQSRKRYPEYYKEKEEEAQQERRQSGSGTYPEMTGQNTESGMLEDKGARPFEKFPENRKAVQYETLYQNDQRGAGNSAGPDNDGVRGEQ